MRKYHFFGLLFLVICFSSLSLLAQSGDLKEVKFKTSAICETCKSKIEKALGKIDGVEYANLDLSDKYVSVRFDNSKTDEDKIKQAISKTGYDAEDVKADKKAFDRLPACCKYKKKC